VRRNIRDRRCPVDSSISWYQFKPSKGISFFGGCPEAEERYNHEKHEIGAWVVWAFRKSWAVPLQSMTVQPLPVFFVVKSFCSFFRTPLWGSFPGDLVNPEFANLARQ
jgi:hypothetical protein